MQGSCHAAGARDTRRPTPHFAAHSHPSNGVVPLTTQPSHLAFVGALQDGRETPGCAHATLKWMPPEPEPEPETEQVPEPTAEPPAEDVEPPAEVEVHRHLHAVDVHGISYRTARWRRNASKGEEAQASPVTSPLRSPKTPLSSRQRLEIHALDPRPVLDTKPGPGAMHYIRGSACRRL